jgi:hypothetical protein
MEAYADLSGFAAWAAAATARGFGHDELEKKYSGIFLRRCDCPMQSVRALDHPE